LYIYTSIGSQNEFPFKRWQMTRNVLQDMWSKHMHTFQLNIVNMCQLK
jgi:hypothetical protein